MDAQREVLEILHLIVQLIQSFYLEISLVLQWKYSLYGKKQNLQWTVYIILINVDFTMLIAYLAQYTMHYFAIHTVQFNAHSWLYFFNKRGGGGRGCHEPLHICSESLSVSDASNHHPYTVVVPRCSWMSWRPCTGPRRADLLQTKPNPTNILTLISSDGRSYSWNISLE